MADFKKSENENFKPSVWKLIQFGWLFSQDFGVRQSEFTLGIEEKYFHTLDLDRHTWCFPQDKDKKMLEDNTYLILEKGTFPLHQ